MKMLVAARSMKGSWTPGKHWGPEPVVVDVDAETLGYLKENAIHFVMFPMEKDAPAPKK